MESEVDQLAALLDNSKVDAVLLDLPLLLSDQLLAPNCLVLQVNIVGQNVVQVVLVVFIVFFCEVQLCLRKNLLFLFQFRHKLYVVWIHGLIVSNQCFWLE